jgi:hypothetical protein
MPAKSCGLLSHLGGRAGRKCRWGCAAAGAPLSPLSSAAPQQQAPHPCQHTCDTPPSPAQPCGPQPLLLLPLALLQLMVGGAVAGWFQVQWPCSRGQGHQLLWRLLQSRVVQRHPHPHCQALVQSQLVVCWWWAPVLQLLAGVLLCLLLPVLLVVVRRRAGGNDHRQTLQQSNDIHMVSSQGAAWSDA